jgi:hypothetical protein
MVAWLAQIAHLDIQVEMLVQPQAVVVVAQLTN